MAQAVEPELGASCLADPCMEVMWILYMVGRAGRVAGCRSPRGPPERRLHRGILAQEFLDGGRNEGGWDPLGASADGQGCAAVDRFQKLDPARRTAGEHPMTQEPDARNHFRNQYSLPKEPLMD